MKTISKLWQRLGEHIDNCLFKYLLLLVFLLVVLAVAVMGWKSIASYLQQLLGLWGRSAKYDVLKTIGFCIAGILLVCQAWVANKRAKAMEATAREQANATKNTEAGQRQERLKNAIEHLGHKRDSVRMGGAYELFHLAEDTEKLRQTVLNILCAHIRQTTRGDEYKEKYEAKPSEEIQGLLTLLFMDEHDIFKDCSINLQGGYLNGANLTQARLKKANLLGAQLQGAVLWEAQLQGAILRHAQLQGAILGEAQLQGANLWRAQLQGANLYKTQLQGAILREALLQGDNLTQAQLQGANLYEAQLQEADLWWAQLQGANLYKAKLQGADLIDAQLQGANLYKAKLQGADLERVQLQGVSSQEHPSHRLSAEFESRITDRIDKDSDLTGIIFAGGLQEEHLDTLCEGLSTEKAQLLREKLISDVGLEASHELPRDSDAETGTYTQEEAEQWIAEYNKAMQKVPRADDS